MFSNYPSIAPVVKCGGLEITETSLFVVHLTSSHSPPVCRGPVVEKHCCIESVDVDFQCTVWPMSWVLILILIFLSFSFLKPRLGLFALSLTLPMLHHQAAVCSCFSSASLLHICPSLSHPWLLAKSCDLFKDLGVFPTLMLYK